MPDDDPPIYCDIVDADTAVRLHNGVGLSYVHNNDAVDDDGGANEAQRLHLGLLKAKGADVARYTRCTQGCNLAPDELADDDDEKQKSKVSLELQAGQPKFYETENELRPFAKLITIDSGGTIHTMHVVITGEGCSELFKLPPSLSVSLIMTLILLGYEGDYSNDAPDTFSLPTHEPLMIIRDPPGGESLVTYENGM